MRKMLFIVGIGSILFLFLSACSSNKYDEAIDEVIALEDKSLDRGGVHTNIETLKRENTKIKVFEDGKYIQIFFDIRENDEVDKVYGKNGDHYEHVVEDMDGKEPDYTENIDV